METLRINSGGALASAALRAGLVDELSVLLEPRLVGGDTPLLFYRGPVPIGLEDLIQLDLQSADALAGGVAHLRYRVRRVEPRTPAPPRPRAPAQGRRAPNRPEWRSVRDKAR